MGTLSKPSSEKKFITLMVASRHHRLSYINQTLNHFNTRQAFCDITLISEYNILYEFQSKNEVLLKSLFEVMPLTFLDTKVYKQI